MLKGASFCVTNISGANLSDSDLTEANLNVARLSSTNLTGAILNRANLNVFILVFDEVFQPQIQANNMACIFPFFLTIGIQAELSIIPVCSLYHSHRVDVESLKVFRRFFVAE